MIRRDDSHFARLSVEDLDQIAIGLRRRSMRGDVTAASVAAALESVVVRRQMRRLARERKAAANFMSSTWQRMAAWAVTRQ